MKDLNFIYYWQVKKSKILLTFQERKILERMGIIISFSSKLNHDSIIVKKKDNLNKISKLIINKLIKNNLIIY